jgi:hypothetical protein
MEQKQVPDIGATIDVSKQLRKRMQKINCIMYV